MNVMLTTERLVMREFRPDDAATFQTLASDWEVARMTSDIPHPLSHDQALQWLQPSSGEVRLAVTENGVMAGGVGYFRRSSGAAEVGFWLGRRFWGRGIATEAVTALLVHGFAVGRLAAMTSSHFVDNAASRRVLVKCGFEPAGTGRIWSVARGEDVTAQYYWLSRERAVTCLGLPPARARSRWSALIGRFAGAPAGTTGTSEGHDTP